MVWQKFGAQVTISLRETWSCMEMSLEEWSRDNAPRLAAALAFYTLLSVAPLLVIAVSIAAEAFGRQAVAGQLGYQLQSYIGSQGAVAVESMLRAAYHPQTGILAATFGLLVLLFGATSLVLELQESLNTIWHVPPREGPRIRELLRMVGERFYAVLLVFAAGAVLLFSLVVSSTIAAIGKFSPPSVPQPVVQAAAFVMSYIITAVLFAAIYKLLPDVRLEWKDVAVGAAVTALLFTVGRQLIALYLGRTALGSTYGAAGSMVLFLMWVYYSAQLFFLGSEFTKVYAGRLGSHYAQEAPARF